MPFFIDAKISNTPSIDIVKIFESSMRHFLILLFTLSNKIVVDFLNRR